MHRARPFDDTKYRRELRRVTTLDIAELALAAVGLLVRELPPLNTDGRSLLDAARKLVPQIRSAADETDARRELPRPLFEALADAGLFHLAVPRSRRRRRDRPADATSR